jgi:hypothetical protein
MRKDRKEQATRTVEFQDSGLIGLETSDCLGTRTDSYTSVSLAKNDAARLRVEHAAWHKTNDSRNKEDGRPTASQCHFEVVQIARIFQKHDPYLQVEWKPL